MKWRRRRRPAIVVAATANQEVLRYLWARPGLCIREARTADGLYRLLEDAQLVILDAADLGEASLDLAYVLDVLARARVPQVAPATFLKDPERWLQEGQAFAGDVRSLPPRLITFPHSRR